jgi:site-specific DNA-methyltransferase (adenine-specific)
MNIAYNADCLQAMLEMPDNAFDLAVVDPPYGTNRLKNGETSRLRKYGSLQTVNDATPTPEYFAELFRVSKNQIIWGYNHLSNLLPPCSEFIFWYKHQPVDTYADGELAWTSFGRTAKCFDYPYFGANGADAQRIHPTQKPVALYRWIYQLYAKPDYKILDTHLGSGSSRIAAYDAGLDFWGYEIDKEYFTKQESRFKAHTAQINLFLEECET